MCIFTASQHLCGESQGTKEVILGNAVPQFRENIHLISFSVSFFLSTAICIGRVGHGVMVSISHLAFGYDSLAISTATGIMTRREGDGGRTNKQSKQSLWKPKRISSSLGVHINLTNCRTRRSKAASLKSRIIY